MSKVYIETQFASIAHASAINAFYNRIQEKAGKLEFLNSIKKHPILKNYDPLNRPTLNITGPEFDDSSYHIFISGKDSLSKSLKDSSIERIDEITREVGFHICMHFLSKTSISKDFRSGMSELLKYFIEVNYLSDGKIHFDPTEHWKGFDQKKWKEEGVGECLYEMNGGIIYDSAVKLFKQFGFAQHYSSRTLESLLLLKYTIAGREDPNFNPAEHIMEKAIERWVLNKLS